MNKKGAEKYYIVISIILGLAVLAISLVFIFQEYFTEGDLSFEACRQSVVLRNTMPESQRILTTTLEQLKNKFPLKCKTEVVNVEKGDNVEAIIARELARCWDLFGQGQYTLFPLEGLGGQKQRKDCFVCSRIHFSEEVIQQYESAGYGDLDIEDYLYTRNLDNSYNMEGEEFSYVENTYSSFLQIPFLDGETNLRLTDANDIEDDVNRGSQPVISLRDGDLIIGAYFFRDRTYLDIGNWKVFVQEGRAYPFYYQPKSEVLLACELHSIPA